MMVMRENRSMMVVSTLIVQLASTFLTDKPKATIESLVFQLTERRGFIGNGTDFAVATKGRVVVRQVESTVSQARSKEPSEVEEREVVSPDVLPLLLID